MSLRNRFQKFGDGRRFRGWLASLCGDAFTGAAENVSLTQTPATAKGRWKECQDLMERPTGAMLDIQNKLLFTVPLTQAEWLWLALFVKIAPQVFTKNPLSTESAVVILEAFRAAYQLREADSNGCDARYLGNLPGELVPEGAVASSETILQTINKTIEALQNPDGPILSAYGLSIVASNFFELLMYEQFQNETALNEVLRPFWKQLWCVAARSHYAMTGEPIREHSKRNYVHHNEPFQVLQQAGYKLEFAWDHGDDFHLLITMPEPRVMYPMGPYPVIREFRQMLAYLSPDNPPENAWNGEHFFGFFLFVESEPRFYFRAHENGITFPFTEAQWTAFRTLFQRAWEEPEIFTAWDALMFEYGEL